MATQFSFPATQKRHKLERDGVNSFQTTRTAEHHFRGKDYKTRVRTVLADISDWCIGINAFRALYMTTMLFLPCAPAGEGTPFEYGTSRKQG